MANPGSIVVTQKGKKGRTYNSKGIINGKVPVYMFENNEVTGKSDKMAILCKPESLKVIGFID